jgi:hypothetical protein
VILRDRPLAVARKCVPRIPVMLLDQLLWHGRQRNGLAVLSSRLRVTMGKSGWVVAGGGVRFLFIRVGFLACATRSPCRLYPQFEDRLIFSWDSMKISRFVSLGDKPFTSILLDSVAAMQRKITGRWGWSTGQT